MDDLQPEEGLLSVLCVTEVDRRSGWITVGGQDQSTRLPVALFGPLIQLGDRVLLSVIGSDLVVELLT